MGCAGAEGWVARSSKTGMGFTLHIVPDAGCMVQLTGAQFKLPGQGIAASLVLPRPLTSVEQHVYLPFLFDNEGSWNRGEREGNLELAFLVNGAPEVWKLPMIHRNEGYHVSDRIEGPEPRGSGSRGFASPPGPIERVEP
jgi:hypothetical protein